MKYPHGQVTLGACVDDHTKPVDIQNVGKRGLFLDHLVIDAKDGLFAATDVGFNTGGRQGATHGFVNAPKHLAAIAASGHHRLFEDVVAIGVHRREAQVLQLAIQ